MVDASTAVFAALSPDGFDRLAGFDLVAPPLLWSETTSALRELEWRGEIGSEDAAAGLSALLDAPIARRAPRGLYREAWRVAVEFGWAKTYDADYVALARLMECQLLTRDARLRRGAARLVDVIGPVDLGASAPPERGSQV